MRRSRARALLVLTALLVGLMGGLGGRAGADTAPATEFAGGSGLLRGLAQDSVAARAAEAQAQAEAATAEASASEAAAAPVAAGRVRLGGGSGIVFGHGEPVRADYYYMCTLTTIGYDSAGNLVGLTNAHCFYDNDGNQWPGDEIYFDKSRPGTSVAPSSTAEPDLETGVIGTVEYISGGNPVFPGPNGQGLDYAVIKFDPAKVEPTATVGQVTIARIGPPPRTGTIMCKQGRTSGLTCGTKLFDYAPYFAHTIWVGPGDSGSPVAVGQTLVGNGWVTGGSTSMVKIMQDLAARGEIGAGFTPVAP